MTRSSFRFSILALVLAAACARTDAAASAAAGAASASGNVGAPAVGSPAAGADDSISARADSGRIAGAPTARIWVLEASDFQCPFCKQWHDTKYRELVDDYVKTGKIHFAFINLPLSMHQYSVPAAEAAMCVSAQNKFWAMHDSLFATQEQWESLPDPMPKFTALAASVGADTTTWRQCMTKHLTLPLINADRDRIHAVGVMGTPTFFVGGKQVPGGAVANLHGAIEAALKDTAPAKPAQ
jgi:protein-disulfide isomerase